VHFQSSALGSLSLKDAAVVDSSSRRAAGSNTSSIQFANDVLRQHNAYRYKHGPVIAFFHLLYFIIYSSGAARGGEGRKLPPMGGRPKIM